MTDIEALNQAWPMGISRYILSGIEDAIKIGTGCRQYWFRGHPQIFPSLLPTVFREPFHDARPNIEFWAGERFRLRAPSFTTSVPEWEDHLSWLFMMQHFGVPTRLLDWTANILVALYFACDPNDEPGEVWCMNAARLNWCSDYYICSPDEPPIKYLAAEVFLNGEQLPSLAGRLGLKNKPTIPLALIPPFQFPRLAAQMSRFTLHPSRDGAAMIEFLLRMETCLVCYTVPAESKARLRKDLASVGISHETLFHDLESLARRIKEEILEKDFPMVNPPRLGTKSVAAPV